MVHVFLLVSLFSNLNTPTQVSVSDEAAYLKNTSFVEVHFEKAPLVTVGDPVLFNGAIVGNISKIEYDESKKGSTNVSLRLSAEGLPLDSSLVALVGSVKTAAGGKVSSRKVISSNRSFLELLSLEAGANKKKEKGGYVKGFTSFQEFWASKSSI